MVPWQIPLSITSRSLRICTPPVNAHTIWAAITATVHSEFIHTTVAWQAGVRRPRNLWREPALGLRREFMNRESRKSGLGRAAAIIAVLFVTLTVGANVSLGATPSPQDSKWTAQLPEGPGKGVLIANCQFCHSLEKVVVAHRTAAQ